MNNIDFIFDFDGTLVDSFAAVIKNFNILALEYNFQHVKEHEINALKALNSKELIKYLKIPIYKIPSILIKARALMKNEIKLLPSFFNLHEVIKQIHQLNFNLGILTSNSSENVIEWLKLNDMDKYFNFIHIESSYFGKARVLKKVIRAHRMNRLKTYYIGDETRDIESAKACHINAIAVTWGFNSEDVLKRYEPHFIVRNPDDILKLCEKINEESSSTQ